MQHSKLPPLLATKLHLPALRPEWLHRPHLIHRLDESAAQKLLVLSAPPGYGKTTLLSAWAHHRGQRVAWISLDADDNDPIRFARYVIAALQTIDPSIGVTGLSLLHTAPPVSVETLLTLLINHLAEASIPLTLVLDDYHAITADAVHRMVTFFLDHLPPQIQWVIATRITLPLPLAIWRGRGQLTELRADDLRFTDEECATWLAQNTSVEFPSDIINILVSKTEGWIAGVQLAALALHHRQDIHRLTNAFSGSQRYIAAYLTDEVLALQSPDIQDFLCQTAILDRLTAPLCDATTGRTDSQVLLDRLYKENLFLVSLDDEGRWYRYHHLFGDVLRAQLEQRYPERIAGCHCRASEWFEDAGNFDAAIAHASAVPDRERALALLERYAELLWQRGEHTTLRRWFDTLQGTGGLASPRLRVYAALAAVLLGDLHVGIARLQAIEALLHPASPEESTASLPLRAQEREALLGMIAAGRAYVAYYQRRVPDMLDFAQRALQHLPEHNAVWRGGVSVILGNAYMHTGRVEDATQAFSDSMVAGQSTDNAFLRLTAGVQLAISHMYRGQLRRAVACCEELLSSPRIACIPAAGTLHALWGDILREWNQLDAARFQVQKGADLCVKGSGIAMQGWSDFALIKLYFAESAYERMAQVLQDLETLTTAPTWILAGITAWKTRLWLAQDKVDLVVHMFRERALYLNLAPSFLQMQEYVALARLYIAQGIKDDAPARLREAIHLLTRLRQASERGGWVMILIEILILLAQVYHHLEDLESGLRTLDQALILAEPEGFVRIFLDEGVPMVALLRRVAARKDLSAYARILLAADAGDTVDLSSVLAEPLSSRELEVLALMAEGLSNKAISERLFITTGTVKVHAAHIYQKLGVSGRLKAVTWAQELGLL